MNYNELMDKLTRVIEQAGVKLSFIERSIGVAGHTIHHYRNGRLKFHEDTQGKLKKLLDMYNI